MTVADEPNRKLDHILYCAEDLAKQKEQEAKEAIREMRNCRLTLKNFGSQWVTNKKGARVEIAWGLAADEIWSELKNISGNYIKRVNDQVFANGGGKIIFMEKAEKLFGWVASRGVHVEWGRSRDMISRGDFLAYVANVAEAYEYASAYPHFPNVPGFYYINKIESEENGMLDKLVGFFNPDTEKDRAQLKGAFATPFWGHGFGNRPGFLIVAREDDERQGRGTGKTTITDAISLLCKGNVDLSKKADDETIRKALMSAKDIRIARLDNIKGGSFSSETIESLVTAPFLSAHQMYKGHALVPNIYTFFITFNDAELSPDLSQRFLTIRIKRPKYDPEWLPRLNKFIEINRDKIIADIGALIARKSEDHKTITRFPEWEREILNKCLSAKLSIMALHSAILTDRESIDEMNNLKEEFSEFCREKIAWTVGCDPEDGTYAIQQKWLINWLIDFMGKKMSRKAAAKLLPRILPIGFHEQSLILGGINYWVWHGEWHQGKLDTSVRSATRFKFTGGVNVAETWNFKVEITHSGMAEMPVLGTQTPITKNEIPVPNPWEEDIPF